MTLKIPPVIVFFVSGFFMWLLAETLPVGYFDFFGRKLFVYFFIVLAVVVGLASLLGFFRAKTTVDPRNPSKTTQLVTKGVYRFSRNPMYLALLLVLLAWGLWLGNAFNTLFAAGFVSYMNKFQIVPEEQVLLKLFGKSYQKYLTEVRRWF